MYLCYLYASPEPCKITNLKDTPMRLWMHLMEHPEVWINQIRLEVDVLQQTDEQI